MTSHQPLQNFDLVGDPSQPGCSIGPTLRSFHEKSGHGQVQGNCESSQNVQRDVCGASFDTAHVGSLEASGTGEVRLGNSAFLSQLANIFPNNFSEIHASPPKGKSDTIGQNLLSGYSHLKKALKYLLIDTESHQ